MKGRRAQRRRGGLFVLVGFLTVIGATFVAGVFTGRISLARSLVTTARVTDADTEPPRRAAARGLKAPEPASPRLTFYQELTAPLTAPPPPPKPAKTAPPPLVAAPGAPALPPAQRPGEQVEALAAIELPAPGPRDAATAVKASAPAASALEPTTPGRFTVQIAAYRARLPAEALRDKLATSGHDARVVESEGTGGMVYRVQIGEFATRDAARAAATRIGADRSFVTQR
jgi:hypothetical protein